MSKLATLLAGFAAFAVTAASAATAAPWSSSVPFTNTVVSSPVTGGGYPVPPGATRPEPGTCGPQQLNSNHSESWLAVKPGTDVAACAGADVDQPCADVDGEPVKLVARHAAQVGRGFHSIEDRHAHQRARLQS